jgi:3-hydroxyisobutyrate dehydrogenase-like beta-hydroxyacid dehydrogenase
MAVLKNKPEEKSMKVGFIGIGKMGKPMSRHILEAGFELTVHDLRKEAAVTLLEQGAAWADSPKTVAESCQVVLSSLPSPADVQEIVYGPNGLMSGWKTGDIYVDMSTNSPKLVRQISRDALSKDVAVLDAPVTGGTEGAERGSLAIIVGGDKTCLQKIHGILQAMGNKTYYAGGAGCGNVAKLVNNLISLTSNAIMAEAFVLGVKAGVDPQILWEVATSGTANNWDLQRYPQMTFAGNFEPGFRLDLGCKDVGLAVQMGREYGVPLSVGAAVEQSFITAQAEGLGDKSVYSIIQCLERLVGVQVRSSPK